MEALSKAKTKDEFLNKAHEARQARELARKQDKAATIIQAYMKSNYTRRRLKKLLLSDLDRMISSTDTQVHILLPILRKVAIVFRNSQEHLGTMEPLVKRLISSGVSGNDKEDSVGCTGAKEPLVFSILCDCATSDKVKDEWVRVYEFLIETSMKCLARCDTSKPNDIHTMALHFKWINLLTCADRLIALTAATSEGQSKYDILLKTANSVCENLSQRTGMKRKDIFFKLSQPVFKIVKGPKTEVSSAILSEYIQMCMNLLKQLHKNDNGSTNVSLDSSLSIGNKQPQFGAEILVRLLTIPAIIFYVEHSTAKSELFELFNEISLFSMSLKLLNVNDHILQTLTSSPALCLLANLIHLASLDESNLSKEMIPFVLLVTKLLEACQRNTKQKIVRDADQLIGGTQKAARVDCTDESYNHILGWLTRETSQPIAQENSPMLKSQISHLWSGKFLRILFSDLVKTNEKLAASNESTKSQQVLPSESSTKGASVVDQQQTGANTRGRSSATDATISQHSNSMLALRRAFERAATSVTKSISSSYVKGVAASQLGGIGGASGTRGTGGGGRLMTEDARRIALVCYMLHGALKTLRMIRQDILAALCLHDFILHNLWTFIRSLGPYNGMKAFLDHLTMHTKSNTPEFHILMLFCECASHIISILDDSEFYEQQKIFTIDDLVVISQFLNTFVFRVITNQLVAYNPMQRGEGLDPILQSTHKLLSDLYLRDCRRQFAPQGHWLMSKELKMSVFISELEQGKPVPKAILCLLPHIIPHRERVLIFRKLVAHDKARSSTPGNSTFITIHRSRIVEDGYQQLARLPPDALKNPIRVIFINDHGLNEAGIDQDGVFKEFLEDTIKRVFDPALNLFSSTSEQRLYPSPTSRLHEDHLSLFNFVGKMLGKAVYEGIVVDVPFASFFLSRVLGRPQSPLYSPIDELPSLDPELYKSLTYIKHYEGDVSELDLTFSLDQDFMGKIETYELEPGGKFIPVTKDSRVRYIHSVANFRMKTQIEEQTEAFVRGFKSIVNLDWLSMFSASEFQRLISGDTAPIDLHDLRRHTKYFGGFHNNHRVISWLWDILDKDFGPEEHSLFLKFVTSCSKPPLLGFANLEPPFSIRCVEVSDDQDLGDTVGSVIRGFFAIRRSDPVDRLPTSSTCFNLLKLPNYQRRSTLREKLRYAIRSSTGFELS